jgi:nickel/cobalt transporter (NicO) family protein
MRRFSRVAVGGLVALLLGATIPGVVSAHPLGNFTINHYAEIRVGERAIQLDVVIDMAEIPTFAERPRLDANHDGTVTAAELAGAREDRCASLAGQLSLRVNDRPMVPVLGAAGLQLLPGAGGLQTLRTVCEYRVTLAAAPTSVSFADLSYPDRIGWREIVVTGDGTTAKAPVASTSTISARLTRYPTDLLVQPLDQRSVSITVTAGGPSSGPLTVPDAQVIGSGALAPNGIAASAPGGVGSELSALIATKYLTPIVLVLSLLIAAGLGALHAVSPGHGKTVMAAYLVGTRGRARHAIGLALAVTVSHTLGVAVLAVLTLLASDLLPPERLYPILGLASGLTVVAIGAWLLFRRFRQLRLDRAHRASHDERREHGHAHEDGTHRHGPFTHSHVAPSEPELSWRSLVALGLAGGLVPSASALILLLGAVAAGRPAFGLALAVAFGVGMAVVLGGIGLALSQAGRWFEHAPGATRLSRLAPAVPWVTGVVVLVAGVLLTGQALVQRF